MKETKELVHFVVALANAVDKTLEDKKVSYADLPHFINAFMKAPEAFAGVDKVKSEWDSGSPELRQLLVNEIKQELDLKNDKTEEVIEGSIKIVLEIFEIVKKVKA